jgi:hypothetical protein
MKTHGLDWRNVMLGFQPTADYVGTVEVPRRIVPQAPKLSWMDRLDRWFWTLEQKQREAYLAQAVDIVDLEQRMRKLERVRQDFVL